MDRNASPSVRISPHVLCRRRIWSSKTTSEKPARKRSGTKLEAVAYTHKKNLNNIVVDFTKPIHCFWILVFAFADLAPAWPSRLWQQALCHKTLPGFPPMRSRRCRPTWRRVTRSSALAHTSEEMRVSSTLRTSKQV